METDDLRKLMNEVLAVHKELEYHAVRMMERQGDFEAMMKETQMLVKQGAERQRANEERQSANEERQSANEERQRAIEELVKQVAQNNIRLSRIIEAHDYDIEELDARLLRLEERKRNGRA